MLLSRFSIPLNVPGVIISSLERGPPIVFVAPAVALVTMAKKAAVPGEGGGKLVGPPSMGVIPVPGVSPVLTKLLGSKLSAWETKTLAAGVVWLLEALEGESGSPRMEEIAGVLRGQRKGSSSPRGVVIWLTPGRTGREIEDEALERSGLKGEGRSEPKSGAGDRLEPTEDAPKEDRLVEKDCSNGFGSASSLDRVRSLTPGKEGLTAVSLSAGEG